MTKRDNHYEAAFEAYLRDRKIAYVAVDETRRSIWGDGTLKSLDFIVSPTDAGGSYLVDVKGRKFPSGQGKQYWRNWSTDDDLQSMARWEQIFGRSFSALLVFAYIVVGDQAPLPPKQLFKYRGNLYGFVGIRLNHYACWAKPMSKSWGTVSLPAARFRDLAEPLEYLFEKSRRVANFQLSTSATIS